MRWTRAGLEDPVIKGVSAKSVVAHWHEDTWTPVENATLLASTDRYTQQAFRLGESYGFQFHLEVDEPMIHRWLRVEENRREIFAVAGAEHLDTIYRETPDHIVRLTQIADRVFRTFVDLFGVEKRLVRLPSR